MSLLVVHAPARIEGRHRTQPVLVIHVEVHSTSESPIELHAATLHSQHHEWLGSFIAGPLEYRGTERLHPKGNVRLSFEVPFTAESLRAVEAARAAKAPGELYMDLNMRASELIKITPRAGTELAVFAFKEMQYERQLVRLPLTHDAWLQALRGMGYDDFAVFELPIRKFQQHKEYQEALKLLRAAEQHFRNGAWRACAVEARTAVERLAHITAELPRDKMRQAFEELFRSLAPEPAAEPRRAALTNFALGLYDLRHGAAHGGLPIEVIERPEAELALTVALALFRYVGERWARPEENP